MLTTIKTIEDLSINAWPSHQLQFFDGWVLRYSAFYTHRTNCVEQIGPSVLPLEEKIDFAEDVYRKWNTPSVFKITPLSDALLDRSLAIRGYEIQHHTTVMTKESLSIPPEETIPVPVRIESVVTGEWIESLFSLKGSTNPVHRTIVPSMYAAIPMEKIAVSIQDQGRIIATGLGILDREYVGIYAIHVHEDYRKRGYATALLHAIEQEAIRRGAKRAYLQVVSDNLPAKNLYRSRGFREFYRYYFRTLPLQKSQNH